MTLPHRDSFVGPPRPASGFASAEVIAHVADVFPKWSAEDTKIQASQGIPNASDVEHFVGATRQWADSAGLELRDGGEASA
jgi:hypothetical protein